MSLRLLDLVFCRIAGWLALLTLPLRETSSALVRADARVR
jgi:hypothetical protein